MAITRRQRFQKLNWNSPKDRILPHGWSGILSISSGVYLILHSIVGNLHPYRNTNNDDALSIPFVILLFVSSTFANAWAGYNLTHMAWKETRPIFKRCAVLQMCLSYYVLRFMPHVSDVIHAADADGSGTKIIPSMVHITDISLCVVMMACTLSFHLVAVEFWAKSPAIAIAVAIGTVGITLLSTYPLHLALFGQNWWMCIQDRYPAQNIGMVAFIYVPATVTFSLMLFGATLYMRNILSESEYGIGSAFVLLFCLVGTVLCQEVHIPDVSTQRIYLPCEEPVIGTSEYEWIKAMDFSRYARRILTSALGLEFEHDLYEEN